MNDMTEVEMMDFDEISEWLSDRMQEVDREDFRAIVTMAVMICLYVRRFLLSLQHFVDRRCESL